MFIDIHCHLDMCKDLEGAIKRAKEKNVLIVSQGVKPESNKTTLEYIKKYDNVRVCLGLYPIDALMLTDKGVDSELIFIKNSRDKIIGIGEVGIDLKESDNFSKQKENFMKIIKLAKELDKPLIVHSRKAEDKVVEILEKEMVKKVIMHCFSGSMKLVKKIVENGWYLSVPGNVYYSEQMQLLASTVPIESLFCETDSPYLHPERKRDNEPVNVIKVYEKIAELKKMKVENAERKIEESFKKLFKEQK